MCVALITDKNDSNYFRSLRRSLWAVLRGILLQSWTLIDNDLLGFQSLIIMSTVEGKNAENSRK